MRFAPCNKDPIITHLGLHVKCLIFADFNQLRVLETTFVKSSQYNILRKSVQCEAICSMRDDGRLDRCNGANTRIPVCILITRINRARKKLLLPNFVIIII